MRWSDRKVFRRFVLDSLGLMTDEEIAEAWNRRTDMPTVKVDMVFRVRYSYEHSAPGTDPTPEEIEEQAAAIRAKWSARDYRHRGANAATARIPCEIPKVSLSAAINCQDLSTEDEIS